jgi:hypothetical protein
VNSLHVSWPVKWGLLSRLFLAYDAGGEYTVELSAKDLYLKKVRLLSPKERLRLAVMILNDLMADDDQIEFSDSWTEQDLQDLTTFALSHSENPHEKHRNRP